MNETVPRVRRGALVGVLLLTAGLAAGRGPAVAGGYAVLDGQLSGPGRSRPGSDPGRELVVALRGGG